jgi:flagellar motor protein MotB
MLKTMMRSFRLSVGVQPSAAIRRRLFFILTVIVPIAGYARSNALSPPDTLFEGSTILGRVGCLNDRGASSGVPGVRLYLDTGGYVDTDLNGKFNFRDVEPGHRLLKLDISSLQPQTSLVGSPHREVNASKASLLLVDYTLNCAASSRPDKVTIIQRLKARQKMILEIQPSTSEMFFNGKRQTLPTVDAVLVAPGQEPDFGSGEGIQIYGSERLTWRTTVNSALDVQGWRISIFDLKNREAWTTGAEGMPPEEFSWDFDKERRLFKSGREYVYRIAIQTRGGDLGEGRWRRFVYKKVRQSNKSEALSVWRGELFSDGNQEPTDTLESYVKSLLDELKTRDSKPILVIEIHTHKEQENAAEKMLLTMRQAENLRKLFSDYPMQNIRILPKGGEKPLMPNSTARSRAMNRRIEVYSQPPRFDFSSLAPIAYPGFVVTPHGVIHQTQNRLKRNLTSGYGEKIWVDMRQENGGRFVVGRASPFFQTSAPSMQQQRISLQGNLTESQWTIASDKVELPFQETDCRLNADTFDWRAGNLPQGLLFSFDNLPRGSRGFVEVRDRFKHIIYDLAGKKGARSGIKWSGKGSHGQWVLTPGRFHFNCVFVDKAGNRLTTEDKIFKVVGDWSDDFKERLDTGDNRGELWTMEESVKETEALGNKLSINGAALEVDEDGNFEGEIALLSASSIWMDWSLKTGRHGRYHFPLKRGMIKETQVQLGMQVSQMMDPDPLDGHLPGSLMAEPTPSPWFKALTPLTLNSSVGASGARRQEDALVMPSGTIRAQEPSGKLYRHEASGRPSLQIASGLPVLEEASGLPELPEPSGAPCDLEVHGKQVFKTMSLSKAPPVKASRLWVSIPKQNQALASERLSLYGRTDPSNRLSINGKRVQLDIEGRFHKTLVLPAGPVAVEIVSHDRDGHVAMINRNFQVAKQEWFAMTMLEGAFGVGSQAYGSHDQNTWLLPGDQYVSGRLQAYFKGRFEAESFFDGAPFETLRVTAYADTARRRREDPELKLVDPYRYYATYGDQSEQREDVHARGGDFDSALDVLAKSYLRVEVDDSHLIFGNFKTLMQDHELFRYTRSHFGAQLEIDEPWTKEHRTKVNAFIGASSSNKRHRILVFHGTGGAFYALKDRWLYEGSEVLRLVVRDAISGFRIGELSLVRGKDYDIDYWQGRVIFNNPIPSQVNSQPIFSQNGLRVGVGHPVFIEAEYDYKDGADVTQNKAWSFHATHELENLAAFLPQNISVGVGLIYDDSAEQTDVNYRLYGVQLRLEEPDLFTLEGELAFSRSVDQNVLASYDGGLSFGSLGTPELSSPGQRGTLSAQDIQGWAAKVRWDGDLSRWWSTKVHDDSDLKLPFMVYGQHQDSGFSAGNSVMEQGQSKAGAQLQLRFNEQQHVRLRYDAARSWLFLESDDRHMLRHITSLGYEYKNAGWRLGAGLGHSWSDDGSVQSQTGRLNLYAEKLIFSGLKLHAAQEFIGFGNHSLVYGLGAPDLLGRSLSLSDRLATTVGLTYALGQNLWFSASESVRWSGTQRLQIGLSTRAKDGLRLYVSERFDSGGEMNKSAKLVVGAEDVDGQGSRSYAEYQRDSTLTSGDARAVLGMSRTWRVNDGMLRGSAFRLSYERVQNIRPESSAGNSLSGSSIDDDKVTGFGSGPLAPDRQFSISGYSSGAFFPAGLASRDAFSAGFEFSRFKTLKFHTQVELRYDRADEKLGESADNRYILAGHGGLDWLPFKNLTALSRMRGAMVRNRDLAFDEGQFLDVSLGLALRSSHLQTWGGLAQWTRRYERNAVGTGQDLGLYAHQVTDVLTVEPFMKIGWGFGMSAKIGFKKENVEDADISANSSVEGGVSTTLLALLRMNQRVFEQIELAAEYRVKKESLSAEPEHGALAEVSWVAQEYWSLGVGYNFSTFSDELLDSTNENAQGFFVRARGRY